MPLLLHFTKYANAISILAGGKLRFGNMTNTNDPFELSDLIFEIQSDGYGGYCDRDIIEKKNFRDFYKLLCFTKYEAAIKFDQEILKNIMDKPKMWSHYGEMLNGVCFVFDKASFDAEVCCQFEQCMHNDVEYVSIKDDYRRIRHKLDSAFNSKNHQEIKNIYQDSNILFLKHKDWRDENEYRYILDYESNIKADISVDSSLLAVVFSYRQDVDMQDKINFIRSCLSKPYQNKSYLLDWSSGFPDIRSYDDHIYLEEKFKNMFK